MGDGPVLSPDFMFLDCFWMIEVPWNIFLSPWINWRSMDQLEILN